MYSSIQKAVHSGAPPQTYSIIVSDQLYYEYFYGCRATLSIGDVLPLHGILEGTVICNIEHHVGECGALARASRDYAVVISRNPDNGTLAEASRDYAIVISCKPDNGTSAEASRDYAIMISRNPDNGTSTGMLPAEIWPP